MWSYKIGRELKLTWGRVLTNTVCWYKNYLFVSLHRTSIQYANSPCNLANLSLSGCLAWAQMCSFLFVSSCIFFPQIKSNVSTEAKIQSEVATWDAFWDASKCQVWASVCLSWVETQTADEILSLSTSRPPNRPDTWLHFIYKNYIRYPLPFYCLFVFSVWLLSFTETNVESPLYYVGVSYTCILSDGQQGATPLGESWDFSHHLLPQ